MCSVPAAGIEFVEQDTLPNRGGFKADGEPDTKCMKDTNKYRITVVVSATCAPGLAQHWHRTSRRWLFL